MNVLVACEFSAITRDAWRSYGHDAWSCDLEPTEGDERWHIRDDVTLHIGDGWDLMVAFPPCTYLAASGARWWSDRQEEQRRAIDFAASLMAAPVPLIALENPVGILSTVLRKPEQIIQPWMFGHPETKARCLWLKNLPRLVPENIVDGRESRIHKMSPSPDRPKNRSRTLPGIATAMARQWSSETPNG